MSVKLELEQLRYRYGSIAAVDGVDLVIEAGQFVAILGPSGCGKTTTLRLIAGLLRPTSGRVLLDGRDISGLRPEKRPLGMVFQHLALFPHLSVEENVGFGLTIKRRPRVEVRRRVGSILDLVGLAGFEDRSVHELSGGQQQRVALARALVTEPEILLLDEPLGALDLQIRKEMQEELKALQRRTGITFLFVTHDQTEAMSMSDRVVLMRNGRIVQDAAPFETYTRPIDPFAARFVGDTNLLEGRVSAVDAGGTHVEVGDGELVLPPEDGMEPGAAVALSIRPEHLTLVAPEEPGAPLAGEIVAQSFLGHEVQIRVRTPVGLLLVREGADAAGSRERVGEFVGVAYARDRVRLYRLAASA